MQGCLAPGYSARMAELHAWLKEQMRVHGNMTQADLSRRIDVTQSMVSRWLRDEAMPEPENCRALARVFGTTEAAVLFYAGHLQTQPDVPPVTDPLDDITRAVERLRTLPIHDARRLAFGGIGSAAPGHGSDLDEPDPDIIVLLVEGDCLAPDVVPGDVLLMSRSRRPVPGDVVSVHVNGERHIKRVVKRNGTMLLTSKRGDLILPTEGAEIEGVMYDRRPKPAA